MEPGVSYLQWLQKAESRGLDIVAITDHNTVEGIARLRAEIERLTWLEQNDRLRPQERRDLDEYRRLGNKLLVLPGFEFTATFGFHVLGIFPPDTPLRVLELILLRLNVPVERLAEGSTEVGATADVLTAYRLIDEAGGLAIAAHVNSTHGVAMRGFNFGGQTKIAYTQDPHLHALEVTDLDTGGRRSTAKFFDGSKPEYPRRMHCIQGSDAHRLVRDPKDKNRLGIGDRVTEILLPEVSFEALAAALKGDDFSVTRPYRPLAEEPFDFVLAAREAGNTIVQSFHESLVLEGGRINRVLADVVAFANTQGGTLFLGASAAKKGPPRGVDNPQETIARLAREIEQDITPPLACRMDTLQSQGATIVRVQVPNGPDKPYALRQTRIYIRQEGETSEAVRDEIVQLVLASRSAAAEAAEAGLTVAAAPVAVPVEPPATAPAPPAPAAVKPSRRRRRRSSARAEQPAEPVLAATLQEIAAELPATVEPVAAAVEPIAEPEADLAAAIAAAGVEPAAESAVAEPESVAEPTLVEPESVLAPAAQPEQTIAAVPPVTATPEAPEPDIVSVEAIAADERTAMPTEAPAHLHETMRPAAPPADVAAPVTSAAEFAPEESTAASQPARPAKRRTRSRKTARVQAEAAEPVETVAEPATVPVAVEHTVEAPPGGESAVAAEFAFAAAPAVPEPTVATTGEEAETATPVETVVVAAEQPNILEAPAVGVEIIAVEERQGTLYFTVRDLRNCSTVHNVTAASARKLWSYAINQYLKQPIDPERVVWQGDYGLWQVGRRARKYRYDLVKRLPDGSLRVFYGVTADGMDGPWAQFLKEEDRAA